MSETVKLRVSRFGRPVEVDVPSGLLYSGVSRSGMCACGHVYGRHHLQLVLDASRIAEVDEEFVPGECLDCEQCQIYRDTGVSVDE